MAEADEVGHTGHGERRRPTMQQRSTSGDDIANPQNLAFFKLESVFGPGLRESTQIALTHRRLFVAVPLAMIGGLTVCVGLPRDPAPIVQLIVLIGIAAATYLVRRQFGAWQIGVLTLAACTGFCLPSLHGTIHGGAMLAYPAFGQYRVQVDQIISADAQAQRVIVSDIQPLEGARALPIRRARLFVRNSDRLGAGDIIESTIRFGRVPSAVVPGGFDFQFHAYFDGIGSYGNTSGAVKIVHVGRGTVTRWLEDLRQTIGLRIDTVLEQPAQGIARALIIGDQSQIEDDTREMMAAAGLAHVLAISGLHLTLVAGGVFAALRMGLAHFYGLGQSVSLKKLAAVCGMVTAIFYLMISGGSVSATRATIMLLLVFGAVLAGRRALTMRNVAIAAILVIALDPAAVFRPGFQLSFAAVAALIAIYEMSLRKADKPTNTLGRAATFLGGVALTSIIAGLATLLFAAYHFQQTAPLGVLGNIAALPIVGFVVLPACFVAVLLMPLALEGAVFGVMQMGTDAILAVAHNVATWSAPIAAAPLLNSWSLLIGLGGLGWLVFFTTRLRFVGPLVVVPLVAVFGLDVRPDVLIADSSQAVAMREEGGMALIAGRSPSFATNAWSQTYIEPIAKSAAGTSCDQLACINRSVSGFSVSVVKQYDAFAEECSLADLVITRLDAPNWCQNSTTVIDAERLRRGGVHWLKWQPDDNGFEIRMSIPNPNRAWRIPF